MEITRTRSTESSAFSIPSLGDGQSRSTASNLKLGDSKPSFLRDDPDHGPTTIKASGLSLASIGIASKDSASLHDDIASILSASMGSLSNDKLVETTQKDHKPLTEFPSKGLAPIGHTANARASRFSFASSNTSKNSASSSGGNGYSNDSFELDLPNVLQQEKQDRSDEDDQDYTGRAYRDRGKSGLFEPKSKPSFPWDIASTTVHDTNPFPSTSTTNNRKGGNAAAFPWMTTN